MTGVDELGRPVRPTDEQAARVWDAVARIPDPEIPVVTIEDLGMLREVQVVDGKAVVVITPTYSGCPAMGMISEQVREALDRAGFVDAEVRQVLQPAWTTDWMSEEARVRLEAYGIAPPSGQAHRGPVTVQISTRPQLRCPRCKSTEVKELSRFGSTSCKALYQCRSCAEPFDYFKVL